MVKTKKKPLRPVDVPNMIRLIEEANVTYYMIEKACKIGNGIVSRGLKENTPRPIPPKWELPILKYLRKKIAEKEQIERQTCEVMDDLGMPVPEKESGLPESEKGIKKSWFEKLHAKD